MKTCLNEIAKLTYLDGVALLMTDPPPVNSTTAHIYIYIYTYIHILLYRH